MILVDSSVWIDHLRRDDPELHRQLLEGGVATHPFVIEELACGHLPRRQEVLELLRTLPRAPVASHVELLHFVDRQRLGGSGLGVVDVHLLASALLSGAILWSRDAALCREASRLGVNRH